MLLLVGAGEHDLPPIGGELIHIDGVPMHIIDTAGLRETSDQVEQIGIERTWKAIDNDTDSYMINLKCFNRIFFQQINNFLNIHSYNFK